MWRVLPCRAIGGAAVLEAGFEPARAFAQGLVRTLRLPISPLQPQPVANQGKPVGHDAEPDKRYRAAGVNLVRDGGRTIIELLWVGPFSRGPLVAVLLCRIVRA